MSTDCKLKISKNKKIVGELTAENIDNTAPVQKILEDLYYKNGQAYLLYTNTLKQRRTTKNNLRNFHHLVPGQPLYAFSDDWDGQLDTSFFEPFSYKSFPPKMINTMRYVDKSDPVTAYLKLKYDWHHGIVNLRRRAYLNKAAEKFEKLNDEVVRCPKILVDLAAHVDSDPDPYFDSSYNWYYAGNGNMHLICIDWVDYLLHSEFSCLFLTEFNKANTKINQEDAAKYDCDCNILETICSTQNIVAIRCRNKCVILKIIVADDKLHFEVLKKMESEMPYTGISFDSFHKNILYVTSVDQTLCIVNLDRMIGKGVKLKSSVKTLCDNWNSVISTERAFYTHIGRSFISLYDKRSNDVSCVWKGVRNITDEMYCNDISAARQLETAPLIYVTTDHHLFSMDLRYSESSKITPVQRWNHGMQCVPTYITKCSFEMNKDLICLISQWCEDMCVVPNFSQSKNADTCILTIPYRPPSILNALEEAKANMTCNDLYNPIDGRLHTTITGSIIMEQNEKYSILLQNSLGDVSCHTIFPEYLETFMENDSSQRLPEWSASYQLPKKKFEVTSVVDIASILRKLKKVPTSFLIGDLKSMMRDKNRFDEKEIFDAFENEELDSDLLDIWTKDPNDTAVKQPTALNLHYSDSE